MLCAINAVLPSELPTEERKIDLASEWRMVKRLSPPERLLWLETTPGVEIHFGDSLPIMLKKLCGLVETARSRAEGMTWTDPRFPHRRRLTTECLCDNCRDRKRWPNYYGLPAMKWEEDRPSRRGWMSYECWLEAFGDVEEGIPKIPGARSIVGDGEWRQNPHELD